MRYCRSSALLYFSQFGFNINSGSAPNATIPSDLTATIVGTSTPETPPTYRCYTFVENAPLQMIANGELTSPLSASAGYIVEPFVMKASAHLHANTFSNHIDGLGGATVPGTYVSEKRKFAHLFTTSL